MIGENVELMDGDVPVRDEIDRVFSGSGPGQRQIHVSEVTTEETQHVSGRHSVERSPCLINVVDRAGARLISEGNSGGEASPSEQRGSAR
ncbi:MAG: hypothetical protein ACRDUW_14290 [Pseudonocardiaceae bacterium]